MLGHHIGLVSGRVVDWWSRHVCDSWMRPMRSDTLGNHVWRMSSHIVPRARAGWNWRLGGVTSLNLMTRMALKDTIGNGR